MRIKAVLLCLRYSGIKVMIVRKTYRELRENHILPLCQLLHCMGEKEERIAQYSDSRKEIDFPNGSRILFRYCDSDRDSRASRGRKWMCSSWTRPPSRARRKWTL